MIRITHQKQMQFIFVSVHTVLYYNKKNFNVYDVCRIMMYVAYDVCRLMTNVTYDVCRLKTFVGYDVCLL